MTAKRITYLSLFTAAALALSLLESALPPLFAFAPGTKLGISNAVVLCAVLILGVSDAFVVLIVKCLLSSTFQGNIGGLMYSVPAGVFALIIEAVLIKFLTGKISITAVSLSGAFIHNITQLGIASLITEINLLPLMPLFLLASAAAGVFTGLLSYYTLRYFPKKYYLLPDKKHKEAL